jgi:hypothetical protein
MGFYFVRGGHLFVDTLDSSETSNALHAFGNFAGGDCVQVGTNSFFGIVYSV